MIILRKRVAGVSAPAMSRFAARACRAAGLSGTVDILITGNDEVQRLNREFRRKNKPTDVLSFPSEADCMAGDIAISADIAKDNGKKLGHGTATELKVLILHGILHLAGYDHERDNGEMAEVEQRLRAAFRLPQSLIERASTPQSATSRSKTSRTKTSRTKTKKSAAKGTASRRRR